MFRSISITLIYACVTSFGSRCSADQLPEPIIVRGTQPGTIGPNLMADSSFESMDARVFELEPNAPFSVAPDPHAHTGKTDLQVTLSRSGKRMYSRVSVWSDTDYVSSIWVRGTGSGTWFVATDDLSRRLAATTVKATTEWREVSLPWNSGAQTLIAIGFQDDVSSEGALYIDDIYAGLKDGGTIAFVAPPQYDPKPHAPAGFSLIFDDEFDDRGTIDVNNTQQDGYKWHVKGMWFPSTSASMYEILPTCKGASGVLEIKDAPVAMSWNFSTTFFDEAAPEGYRGTVFLPGTGIYYEARIACEDLAHIGKNGWAGFWSGTMPIASRPRNMNPPPWSMSVENVPMPGWTGKWETIENDIMEYNPSWVTRTSSIPRFMIGAVAPSAATSATSMPLCIHLPERTTRSGTPTDSCGYPRPRRTAGTATDRFTSTACRSRPRAGSAIKYPKQVSRSGAIFLVCATEHPNHRLCGGT